MTDQKNTIIAIVLSALILIAWQIYFGLPQMEKQKQIQEWRRYDASRPTVDPNADAQKYLKGGH